MLRRLLNIFEFRKKIWMPLAILGSWVSFYLLFPELAQQLLMLGVQGIYLISFMVVQVVAYFGFFFYYLAGRVRIVTYAPGSQELGLTWDDYIGDEIKRKAKQWVHYLEGVESFTAMGGYHQVGLLMVGPPGSGKTYLAKVMASQASCYFMSVDGASLMGTFIGIGPLKVTRMANDARNKAREWLNWLKRRAGCIVFIDEIDAIGTSRMAQDPRGYSGYVQRVDAYCGYQPLSSSEWGNARALLRRHAEPCGPLSPLYTVDWGAMADGELAVVATALQDECYAFLAELNEKASHDPYAALAAMPVFGMGSQILNSLLAEMDGFLEKRPRWWRLFNRISLFLFGQALNWDQPKVMFIGSSNIPEVLDKALTRPGRMGRRLHIMLPDIKTMERVADYYLRKVRYDGTITPEKMAQTAIGQTPAFVKFTLNDALMVAHGDGRGRVGLTDWLRAVAESTMGDKQPLPLVEPERWCLAVHEASHAVVNWSLTDQFEIIQVTTEKYGQALAHVGLAQVEQWLIGPTESMAETAIRRSMGGMAGEKVILGERHMSAGADAPNVQRVLNAMAQHGFFEEIWPDENENLLKRVLRKKRLELWEETQWIVDANRQPILALAKALMERKEIPGEEAKSLVYNEIEKWPSIKKRRAEELAA